MKTARGFTLVKFEDDYGAKCSLQESSAVAPHVWLGISKPEIIIQYKDAIAHGMQLQKKYPETNECGWCDYPIPEEALVASRMHLSKQQAKWLAKRLNFFARHGYLQEETEHVLKENEK